MLGLFNSVLHKDLYSAFTTKRTFTTKTTVLVSKFKDEKLRVLEQPNTSFNSFKAIKLLGLYPTLGLLIYKFVTKVIAFKILGLLFYGVASLAFFVFTSKIIHRGGMIIRTIDLLKDGKRCLISTADGNVQIVDISAIRKFNQAEKYVYEQQLMRSLKSYAPIVINDVLFLTFINSTIKEAEVMSAISEGKYIDVTDKIEADNSSESIDASNTIDI